MKKRTAVICFLIILIVFLMGSLAIYYYFHVNTDENIPSPKVSLENDPYAWEDTKEFFESKGCRREYVVEWDIPEDNKIKEERYINDRGEKLALNWYADGTADVMLITTRP